MIGIYKIENKINGKVYIGLSKNIEERWYQHKWSLRKNNHPNKHLQSAWNKYGEENFIFAIIEECNDDIINDRERYWIEYYNSYLGEGYNKTYGGEGYDTINPVVRFDLYGNYIDKYENAYIAEMNTGCSATSIYQCCNHNIGIPWKYIWLYEHEYLKDKTVINKHLPEIICQCDIDDGHIIKEWLTITEINEVLGYSTSTVSSCISGRYKSCYNYIFIYKKDISLIQKRIEKVKDIDYHTKRIVKISFNGDILERFNSVRELTEKGYHNGSVIKCCKHQKDSYLGFIWLYEEEIYLLTNEFCKDKYEKFLNSKSSDKIILQYDLNGNLIRKWKYITELKKNKYTPKLVRECCLHIRDQYKNSIWKYKEECVI